MKALAATAVVFVACLSFLPSIRNAYVQDDHVVVESSPLLAHGSLREIFASDYWGDVKGNDRSLYRPLTILTWAAERRLAGASDPRVSHAVNLALHAAASLLLLALAGRLSLSPRGATLAALLFAAHPIHTEAVASVVGRSDVLATLFTLAALVLHAREGGSGLAAWLRALGTGACVLAALCSKEAALVAPLLLVVWDLKLRPPIAGRRARWLVDRACSWAPSFAALGAYLFLRALALEALFRVQSVPSTDNRLVLLHGAERLATALGLVTRYVALFLLPVGLSADRSGGVIEPEGLVSLRALAGLLLLAAPVLLILSPRARRAGFAAALFLLPYLVVGNLLLLIRATLAERVLYLPSCGLCLLAGLLLARSLRQRAVVLASLAVVALLSAASFRQSGIWRNEETLFSAALRASPESPRAAFVLGKVRAAQGRHAEALALFERARTVWPDFVGAWVDEATELAQAGRLAEAESRLREALARYPEYGGAYVNLGIVLRKAGRTDEAERALRKGAIYDPSLQRAWAELGHLYLEAGRFAEAASAYGRAVALGRTDLLPRLREASARRDARS